MCNLNCALILFFIFSYTHSCLAQVAIPVDKQDDTNNSVVIHADARLATLLSKKRKSNPVGYISSGQASGCRYIMVMTDTPLSMRKSIFMRRYPAVPTYMTYVAPISGLKVGNFTRKEDAFETES